MTEPTHAVIGGSGLYELMSEAEAVTMSTPYGQHSSGLSVGSLGDRSIAFLPRHGAQHELPPHLINYRANVWALRRLGVRQVLAPCAVGSLQTHLVAGTFAVPDQVVDRTSGRCQTFVERGAVHVSFADPYCPIGRESLIKAAHANRIDAVDGGTMVVIDGPRFSTRAESQSFAREGWSLVNMTGQPEAVLAREMAMCYSAIALVTDIDAGLDPASAVNQLDALAVFSRNLGPMRAILKEALTQLPDSLDCRCQGALDNLEQVHVPATHFEAARSVTPPT